MEKYIVDGKVAILYSPGYGAGWSTWNEDKNICWDKRIVEFVMKHKDDHEFMHDTDLPEIAATKKIENFLESIGYDNVYLGGFNQIEITWLPIGTRFLIKEYDGSEHIETADETEWNIA